MHNLEAQVAREFHEAARWRGTPTPDQRPRVTAEQDVVALFRAATRRAAGVRIVTR